jgi:hypothetical protein
MRIARVAAFLACVTFVGAVPSYAVTIGPLAYLQASDSPFTALNFGAGYFHLENFEDHNLSTPGASSSVAGSGPTSIVFRPTVHDSVDADDSAIDGSGLLGDSWFNPGPTTGFAFNGGTLGALPTHVGLVWTDGPFQTAVSFTAWGADGTTVVCSIPAAVGFANSSFNGETAEDRFFGCVDVGGISRVQLTNLSGGGIEVDHLQYGNQNVAPVPEPASLALLTLGVALAVRRRTSLRRR